MKKLKDQLKSAIPIPKEGLVFFYPPEQGRHSEVVKELSNSRLSIPTLAEVVSLVYSAFKHNTEFSEEITYLMKQDWIWGFNKITRTDRGINIQEKDETKYVPFGFKTGKQSVRKLEKNPYIIGLVGKEGAEKLAEIADEYRSLPCVHLESRFLDSYEPRTTMIGSFGFGGDALYIDFDSGDSYAHGFGLIRN